MYFEVILSFRALSFRALSFRDFSRFGDFLLFVILSFLDFLFRFCSISYNDFFVEIHTCCRQ